MEKIEERIWQMRMKIKKKNYIKKKKDIKIK